MNLSLVAITYWSEVVMSFTWLHAVSICLVRAPSENFMSIYGIGRFVPPTCLGRVESSVLRNLNLGIRENRQQNVNSCRVHNSCILLLSALYCIAVYATKDKIRSTGIWKHCSHVNLSIALALSEQVKS